MHVHTINQMTTLKIFFKHIFSCFISAKQRNIGSCQLKIQTSRRIPVIEQETLGCHGRFKQGQTL